MAYERDWAAVPPQSFTVNGGQWGLVTIANTAGFRVKQTAYLKNTANQTLPVQIKVVLSPTTLIVGYSDNQIANWPKINISAWTVASGAVIGAEWQPKSRITPEDIIRASYEGDPVAAIRALNVDQYGNPWSDTNPLPVNADVTVNSVQLFTLPYDSISAAYPTAITEVYKTYVGGLSGTLQQTVTVTYVDSTKNELVSVVRT
jgi:hypothetical protein